MPATGIHFVIPSCLILSCEKYWRFLEGKSRALDSDEIGASKYRHHIILRGSSSTFRRNPHQLMIKDGIIYICAHISYQNETQSGVWQGNCSELALELECTPDAYGVATSSSWDCLGSSDTFVRTGCAHGW